MAWQFTPKRKASLRKAILVKSEMLELGKHEYYKLHPKRK